MVGKKTLRDYGFQAMFDYYDYIVDSLINGQRHQVRDLFKKLSREQRKEFLHMLKGPHFVPNEETRDELLNICIELM